MKKLLILSVLLPTFAFAGNWQVGDSAYIYAKTFGGMYYYAYVSIDSINNNNNKSRVFVDQICWDSMQGVWCDSNRQEGSFKTGQYKWVYTDSLVNYPSQW